MEDVSPKLFDAVKAAFDRRVKSSRSLQAYAEAFKAGNATKYADAYDYTEKLGEALADSFREVLTADALPNGKMYFNIAQNVVEPFLVQNYASGVDAAVSVEDALNKAAGIGLKSKAPAINKSRIDGILTRLATESDYEKIKWILGEPVVNLTQSAVDSTIKENVEFHAKSGFLPVVTRRSERKCCEWCSRLAGVYRYPNIPKDVYRRHENCRCTTEYDPADGRATTDVWTKEQITSKIIASIKK